MFGKRYVVHADVDEIAADDHVASFTVNGQPGYLRFEPRPLVYSKAVKNHIAEIAQREIPGLKKGRLLVNVWRRGAAVNRIFWQDKWFPYVIGSVIVGLVVIVAAMPLIFSLLMPATVLPSESESTISQVLADKSVLFTNVALNGATAAGLIFYRASKRSLPLEPPKTWVLRQFIPIIVALSFSLFLLTFDLPTWITALVGEWKAYARIVNQAVSALATFVSIAGAFLSGHAAVRTWTFMDDLQRRSPRNRRIVDALSWRSRA